MSVLAAIINFIGAIFLYLTSPEHRKSVDEKRRKKKRKEVVAGAVDAVQRNLDSLLTRYRAARRKDGED